ncbi:nuclear pore complex protein Nup155 [Octopus sinensis]|uniref:Nuclear pore complex protein Nup155 n=1 Tax=Octopus sinensis TaxID=2607531 RepID=A0A6P7T457_9MOLL|nr:nuclear pore complex protein Nup155 [Octopus sinensis]
MSHLMSPVSLSSGSVGMNMVSPLVVVSQKDSLECSVMQIDTHIQEDDKFQDLSYLLHVPADNSPSVSGLHDYDYPTFLNGRVDIEIFADIGDMKKVPLPPELVEHFGHMQCQCSMGLFPEIERAWLAIDSDIYIWRYEDGQDVAYYDGVDETILCAALVPPKPDVFQSSIRYILVLATTVEIVLLGVRFTDCPPGALESLSNCEMHLITEPLFSLPSDNLYVVSIVGMNNGRIFMAGKDSCLYELAYQGQKGWFGRQCKKINHSTSYLSYLVPSFINISLTEEDPLLQICIDQSRNILYTRSDKGTIQVFDLGEDGKGMSRVVTVPLSTIIQAASHIAGTIDPSLFKTIIHIAPLTASESPNFHLVAITQAGVRLYFAAKPFGAVQHISRKYPSMLKLVHVRLPPGYSANPAHGRPSNVRLAHYKKGTLLMIQSRSEENDLLWTISSDCLPFNNVLKEIKSYVPLEGRTWSMCEVPAIQTDITPEFKQRPDPPVVVTQHNEKPRKFVFINAQGCTIVSKLRPVDQLRRLLISCQGPESEAVKDFFSLHKVDQACAACLILACSRSPSDQQIVNWAQMAFFMYGGHPHMKIASENEYGPGIPTSVGPASYPGQAAPGHLSYSMMYDPATHYTTLASMPTPAPGSAPIHSSTPMVQPHPQQPQQQQQQPFSQSYHSSILGRCSAAGHDVVFSGKHNGICLYLSRILRPIWDQYIVSEYHCKTDGESITYLVCKFTSEQLQHTSILVRNVSDFIDFNSRLDSPLAADSPTAGHPTTLRMTGPHYDGHHMDEQTRKQWQIECQNVERASLQNVRELITQVEQVLSLLKVLVDHQFHMLARELNQDQQAHLKAMTFKQLVVSGREMCNALITSLIDRYLHDNATIDVVSSTLRKICPRLYSTDDETCSKALELLQAAKVNPDQIKKKQQLEEALMLYKSVSQPLQLSAVCNQLSSVQYYAGIVDLCLCIAQKRDPQNFALHFHKNGEPPEDNQGKQAYKARMDCYKHITETLVYLLYASVSHPQSPSTPKSPGKPLAPDPNRLSPSEAELQKEQVFKLALKSDDELFHVALYDWLLQNNLNDKLIEIKSPFLETYLKWKASIVQDDKTLILDLLWKFYQKNKNFPAAARILSRLAEKHGSDLTLSQRVEYLSRAIACAKGSTLMTSVATEGEFLHELEEKMDVAKLQMMVYNAFCTMQCNNEVLTALNSDLLDISSLYEKFADPYGLHECKLAIVHSAGLFDPALIENLWQSIIDSAIDSAKKASSVINPVNISNQLLPIGKQYVSADRYFPLAFITKYLEQCSCQHDLSPIWVFNTLLDFGVKPTKLLQVYDSIFKFRGPSWQKYHKPLHILTVLYHLIDKLTNMIHLIPTAERRQFFTYCLDAVSSYQVELQAISSTDPEVRQLVNKYRSVQAKLERM